MKSYVLVLLCVIAAVFGHADKSDAAAGTVIDGHETSDIEQHGETIYDERMETNNAREVMEEEEFQSPKFMRGSNSVDNGSTTKRDLHTYAKGTYAKGTTYYVAAKGTHVVAKGAKGAKGTYKGHKGYHTHTNTYITVKRPEPYYPHYYGPGKGKGGRRYYGYYGYGPSKGGRYYKGYYGYYGS